jgi:hypothetical protein
MVVVSTNNSFAEQLELHHILPGSVEYSSNMTTRYLAISVDRDDSVLDAEDSAALEDVSSMKGT